MDLRSSLTSDSKASLNYFKENRHVGASYRLRSGEDFLRDEPTQADAGDERDRLVMAVRHADPQPLSTPAAPAFARQIGRSAGVSRPEGFHPRPLAERCVNLSIHTAPIRRTCWFRMFASARRGPHFPAPAFAGKDWREFCGTESACTCA